MPDFPLQGLDQFTTRALYVGNRLDLHPFRNTSRLAASPLAIGAGAVGVVVLFRFGVVVMFGLSAAEEAAFLTAITSSIIEPYDGLEVEEAPLKSRRTRGIESIPPPLSCRASI